VTPSDIQPWLAVIALVISIGSSLFMFLTSGAKQTATKVDAIDARLSKIEGEMPHLPNKENVHKQQLDISEMKGEIGIIKKSIEATERTTRRVEDFLMERK
jgi:hypothetical protein